MPRLLFLAAFLSAPAFAAPFVPERDAQCVAVSPDGTLVATGKSGMSNSEFPPSPHPTPRKCAAVEIWEASTGKKLRRVETFGDFTKLAFSPDGKQLAYSRLFLVGDELEMNEVRVLDVQTGKTVRDFDRCYAFDFSPDGQTIAVLSRSRCVVYDSRGESKLREIKPLGRAFSVSFSPDGRQIAGVVEVDGRYAIRLCDALTGETRKQSFALPQPFYRVVFSPDGQLLATGHPGGNIRLWGVQNLNVVTGLHAGNLELQHPFFSADGSVLGSGGQEKGDVVFWDLAKGQELRRVTFGQGTFRTFYPRPADAVARPELDPTRFVFSPDGMNFVAGCFGGIIRSVSSGQEVMRFRD